MELPGENLGKREGELKMPRYCQGDKKLNIQREQSTSTEYGV